MKTPPIRLRPDIGTVRDLVVDLSMSAANVQLATPDKRLAAAIAATGETCSPAQTRAVSDAANDMRTDAMEHAARVGFGLGLTLATHAARGNVDWLTEALRVVGLQSIDEGPMVAEVFGAE